MQSEFTGSTLKYILFTIAAGLVSSLTFGLAFPIMFCWFKKFEAENTIISGRRLVFEGKAGSLFGNYVLWLFLAFITFGIYSIFIPVQLKRWEAKNTFLSNNSNSPQVDNSASSSIAPTTTPIQTSNSENTLI